jgi:hypothetical protein
VFTVFTNPMNAAWLAARPDAPPAALQHRIVLAILADQTTFISSNPSDFIAGYAMDFEYPTPASLGIAIPAPLVRDAFDAGFLHALKGGKLDRPEFLRLSFRMGFRAAKLHLRAVRRARGVLEFPLRCRMRVTAHWDSGPRKPAPTRALGRMKAPTREQRRTMTAGGIRPNGGDAT